MRPCKAGQARLSREARKPATLPHTLLLARDDEGFVTISGSGEIHYTLDGTEPTQKSKFYAAPFRALDAGTVKAVAFSPAGGRSVVCELVCKKLVGLVKRSGSKLKVVACDSEEKPGEGLATNAVDGKSSTFWHTRWTPEEAPYPHFIIVDVGKTTQIGGITMQGRIDGNSNGCIKKYRIYVSNDGKNWNKPVAEGEFKILQNTEQKVRFEKVVVGRYVKLEALSEVQNRAFASIAELGVLVAL
jgi:hypothetical protein